MEAWQKCPVCDGRGNLGIELLGPNLATPPCPKCLGARIISLATGEPPPRELPDAIGRVHPDLVPFTVGDWPPLGSDSIHGPERKLCEP